MGDLEDKRTHVIKMMGLGLHGNHPLRHPRELSAGAWGRVTILKGPKGGLLFGERVGGGKVGG